MSSIFPLKTVQSITLSLKIYRSEWCLHNKESSSSDSVLMVGNLEHHFLKIEVHASNAFKNQRDSCPQTSITTYFHHNCVNIDTIYFCVHYHCRYSLGLCVCTREELILILSLTIFILKCWPISPRKVVLQLWLIGSGPAKIFFVWSATSTLSGNGNVIYAKFVSFESCHQQAW